MLSAFQLRVRKSTKRGKTIFTAYELIPAILAIPEKIT